MKNTILIILFLISSGTLNSDDHFRQNDYDPRTHEEIYFQNEYLSGEILSESDLKEQIVNYMSGNSQLSSGFNAKDKWESYNKWSCYNSDQTEISCIEGYNNEIIPSIKINLGNSYRDIDFDDEQTGESEKCEAIISEWKNLLEQESEFCVYAAYLQELNYETKERPHSLWMGLYFKTKNGIWKLIEAGHEFTE